MRFCLMLEGQEGVTWERWLAVAAAAERLGFEALFTSDHYLSVMGHAERGSNDAWTLLGGLAARTSSIRLGTLVSPATFRHPTALAKAAVTVDRISGGRAELGMGAGWWVQEHATHGFPFPPSAERYEIYEEQVEIVHGLLSEDVFSFEGPHYALEECGFVPKSVQLPHLPIILGGNGGSRQAALVARFADEFNTVGGTPGEVRERYARVQDAVEGAGRERSSVVTSLMTWVYVGADQGEYLRRLELGRQRDPRAGDLDAFRAETEKDCIFGTPDRAAERLSEYASAGVQRIMLNHELFEDLDMLELLAAEVLPKVEG
jgi:F420-dependent oxidoreductase-like protein